MDVIIAMIAYQNRKQSNHSPGCYKCNTLENQTPKKRWLNFKNLREETIIAIDEIAKEIEDEEKPQFLTVMFSVSSDPDGNATLEFYGIDDNRTKAVIDLQDKYPDCKIFQCKRDAYLQVYPDGYDQPAKTVFVLEFYELKGIEK
jgi:hypothetical protein